MFRLVITSFHLFLAISGCTQQQALGKLDNTDLRYTITLPEFDAKRCIKEVFEVITSADSNGLRFPSDRYCYEVLFSDFGSYRQILITPNHWPKSMPKDCKGIISVKAAFFLLYTNSSDSLFTKKGNEITKKVTQVQSNNFDSLDAKVNWRDWTNSPTAVVGEFRSCQGTPINLYINVGLNLKLLFSN